MTFDLNSHRTAIQIMLIHKNSKYNLSIVVSYTSQRDTRDFPTVISIVMAHLFGTHMSRCDAHFNTTFNFVARIRKNDIKK